MRRSEVYDAGLGPIRDHVQAGVRPVIIVSSDVINRSSPVVLVVPCTRSRRGRRVYSSQVLLRALDGGLDVDSVAMAEQVMPVDKQRLLQFRGTLSQAALQQLDQALLIALGLP